MQSEKRETIIGSSGSGCSQGLEVDCDDVDSDSDSDSAFGSDEDNL